MGLYIYYTFVVHLLCTFHTFTIHQLYIYHTLTIHLSYMHYTFTIHSQYIYYTFTIHLLYIHYTIIIHSPYIYFAFAIHSKFAPQRYPGVHFDGSGMAGAACQTDAYAIAMGSRIWCALIYTRNFPVALKKAHKIFLLEDWTSYR